MRQILLAIMLLCITLTSQRSFVDSAPISEGQLQPNDADEDKTVQELENLKKSIGNLGKTLDLMKSQKTVYTDINGEKESHSETKEELKENGEPVTTMNRKIDTSFKEEIPKSKIETEVEIPQEGIHKTIVQLSPGYESKTRNGNRRSAFSPFSLNILSDNSNQLDKIDSTSEITYSPMDVAEYVFWTGDENGVTAAIEEFLKEGLMSREEAISFLQEIKYHLENLKSHYTQIGLNSIRKPKITATSQKMNSMENPTYYEKPELQSNFDIKQLRQVADKRRALESARAEKSLDSIPVTDSDKLSEEDYEELLERLRVADLLYTEYSLEEVVYQLAKVMFTQSLTRGTAEAQQALRKFTNFMEVEAAQGHISRALEKKVLDILIASITDTLTEHPDLLTQAGESTVPTATTTTNQNFLRQILNANLEDNLTIQDLLAIKEQNKNNHLLQNPNKISSNIPLNFLKYKNS